MSEHMLERVTEEDVSPNESEIILELLDRIDENPNIDPYQRGFASSAMDSYTQDRPFRHVIKSFAEYRQVKLALEDPGIVAPTAVNTLEAIVKTNMLLDSSGQLPPDLHDAHAWSTHLDRVAQHVQGNGNDPERETILDFLLSTANLSTTTQYRVNPLELWLQTKYGKRPGVRILDVGSSLQVMDNQLVAKHLVPMIPPALMEWSGGPITDEWEVQPSARLTQKAAELMLRQTVIRDEAHSIIGMDVFKKDDFITNVFARGSLRIKGELDNPAFMRDFHRLASMAPYQVGYVQADFSDMAEATERLHAKYGKQKFDVLLFATTAGQFSGREMQAIKPFAETHGTDDVMVVFLDFIATSETGELAFTTNWYKSGHYRLIEYNPRQETLNEVLRCRNSRCQQILPIGSIAVYRGQSEYEMPTAEAIMAA